MKVLVTGASGFIGAHVTRSLIGAGHDVLALAVPGDDLWRLRDLLPSLEVLRATLQDLKSIREKINIWRPSACIHLAWYSKPGEYLDSIENLASLQSSLDLLQTLAEYGCERFIGAGTCAEYEMKAEMLTETDKTKPETLYAASKLAFQMVGEQLAARLGIRFTWGRIFYLYGDQEDPRRLVPAAITKLQKAEVFLASAGEQIRDYLHVSDVANAFLFLMEQQTSGIYNICSAKPVTVRELLDVIGKLMSRSELLVYGALPYRNWEPMYICGKNDRMKILGWAPKVHLSVGLQDTIDKWNIVREKKIEDIN